MFRDLREGSDTCETRLNDFQFSLGQGNTHPRGPAVEDLARSVISRLARRRPVEPAPAKIDRFCDALIAANQDTCADFVARLRLDGASHADLTSVYFAAAARMLGT